MPAAQQANAQSNKRKEGESILKAIKNPTYVVALDEHGKQWTSVQLAERLEHWQANHSAVTFLIGGADGLAPDLRARCDTSISFGRMV